MIPFLLDTVIVPGGEAAGAAVETAQKTSFLADNPVMTVVIYCVVFFAIMYFISIRPTQKREKKLAEMRNALTVGDPVITNSGFYGKIVDETYDCWIIEFGLNKGVRVPVGKTEVYGKAEPNMSKEAPPQVEEQPKKKGLFSKGE